MGFLFGGKPKAPKPLDPVKVGAEQANQNQTNIEQQSAYNRPTVQGRFGQTGSWQQTGTDANGNPTFKFTESLGPQGQGFATGFANLGNQYINFAKNPGSTSSTDAFNQADQFWQQREGPRQEQARAALDNKLRNQGFDISSEGYKNAMADLDRNQSDARAGFLNSAQNQFFNQGIESRQQRMRELDPGIQYAGQTVGAALPQTSQLQIPNVDLASLYGLSKNQEMQNYNTAMQSYNGMLGGLASLGGTLGSAAIKAYFK